MSSAKPKNDRRTVPPAARKGKSPPPKFPAEVLGDPLRALAGSAPRLALAVEAISPRRDVRILRARVVLLLLRLRCPRGGRPARSWYVPGAAARLGATGLVRIWPEWFGDAPPSERRLRDHLAALERGLVLVRAPGAWLPTLRPAGDPKRHRYPDTFHLLEDDADAVWWESAGPRLLEAFPEVRTNPTEWRRRIGDWRARRGVQGELFGELANALSAARAPRDADPEAAREADLDAADEFEDLVRAPPGTHSELLARLAGLGAPIRGRPRFKLLKNPRKLLAVLALLARALRRRMIIQNRSGWIVSAFATARPDELEAALEEVAGASQERGPRWSRDTSRRTAASADARTGGPA